MDSYTSTCTEIKFTFIDRFIIQVLNATPAQVFNLIVFLKINKSQIIDYFKENVLSYESLHILAT